MVFIKRRLPVIIAFVAGIVFWLQFFVPSHFSQSVLETFTASWAIIMAGAAFILGVLSSVEHHWSKISLRKNGYGYSLVALLVFGTMLLTGWFPAQPSIALSPSLRLSWGALAGATCLAIGIVAAVSYLLRRSSTRDTHATGMAALIFLVLGAVGSFVVQPLASGQILIWQVCQPVFTSQAIEPDSLFMWFFDHCFVPLDATMFSLLAFYIASAAFRAFRARSFEATALLISGCLVMIGRVPLGEQIAVQAGNFHLSVADVASWILNNPNSAAQRGILLGVILSQVAISLRILFGIERTYMGGGE